MPTTEPTVPSCEECGTQMHRIGTGAPRYWSCGYCGTAVPIAA